MKTLLITLLLTNLGVFAAPTCCSTNSPASAASFTDASLYQVESNWTSDYNKQLRLNQLRGRPQIVTMFFSSCHFACPILVHDMKKIEASLITAGLTNVGFVLVSIDPDRDTVEQLHKFRLNQQLNDNWLLLRSESQDVLELAALLGVKFKKEANGQLAHSNIITLLNDNGEIVHQQIGLNTDPATIIAALPKLLKQ